MTNHTAARFGGLPDPTYFPETAGYFPTPVYTHDLLVAGATFEGPAIVEQRESTTVIPPGVAATVDSAGNLLCRIGGLGSP